LTHNILYGKILFYMKEDERPSPLEKKWRGTIVETNRLVDTLTMREAEPGRGIFLGHAFGNIIGEDGLVEPAHRQRLEALLDALRNDGKSVHCALEREVWGAEWMTSGGLVAIDYDQVCKADVLLTFPEDSGGAFVEIGWANESKTPLLIVWKGELGEDTRFGRTIAGALAVCEQLDIPHGLIIDDSSDFSDFESRIIPTIIEQVNML
jgi:hypothetical protein